MLDVFHQGGVGVEQFLANADLVLHEVVYGLGRALGSVPVGGGEPRLVGVPVHQLRAGFGVGVHVVRKGLGDRLDGVLAGGSGCARLKRCEAGLYGVAQDRNAAVNALPFVAAGGELEPPGLDADLLEVGTEVDHGAQRESPPLVESLVGIPDGIHSYQGEDPHEEGYGGHDGEAPDKTFSDIHVL